MGESLHAVARSAGSPHQRHGARHSVVLAESDGMSGERNSGLLAWCRGEGGNRLTRAGFRQQRGEGMTQQALSSLPPSFSPRGGLADEVHRAAYVMQGRLPQIRRALAAVRQQVVAGDPRIEPTKDAWLNAVQDAINGPPLDVQPALFQRVLGEWIARDLFGLEDPTKLPEGD